MSLPAGRNDVLMAANLFTFSGCLPALGALDTIFG